MRGPTFLLPFFVAALAVSGCKLVTPGERAGADGGCPSGETCSTTTPDGLLFQGPELSWLGSGVMQTWPIAAGGTETVNVLDAAGDGGVPFTQPFVARTDDATVLAVTGTGGSRVQLSGVAPGTAKLRMLEPDGTTLYDRVSVTVATPTAIALSGRGGDVPTPDDPDAGMPSHAVLAGGTATVVVTPVAGGATWLVDQSATLGAGAVPSTQPAFDLLQITAPASGTVTVDGTYGSTTLHAALPVVAAASRLTGDTTLSTNVGTDVQTCFYGRTASGATVLGDAWTFSTTAPAFTVTPWSDARGAIPGCVTVHPVATGSGTFDVAFAGATAHVTVTVLARPAGARYAPPITLPPTRTPGDRASAR